MNLFTRQFDETDRRRVVITGVGVIAPNGSTPEEFWASIREGQSAAGPLTRFAPGDSPVRIACQIQDFDPSRYLDAKAARRLDRSNLYSIAAATEAMKDAALKAEAVDADRMGVVEGTSVSTNETVTRGVETLQERGYRGLTLAALLNGYSGAGSGEVALHLGARGHAVTLSTGSASGNDVMGHALGMIQNDDADVMIAGGSEAPLTPTILATFCQAKVVSRLPGDPKRAMRPFDESRAGFVFGEGAGYVVMEELTHALSRGARIYAEVLSHGHACESYHAVAPHPEGKGIIKAMEKAIRRSRIDPSEIDYINAHGTATEANDVVESQAIRRFFGRHANRLGVSSTKPVTGHLMAAAGAVETIVSALAVHHGIMPPTINLTKPDHGCDLDYVTEGARSYPIRAAMNLSSGFGGKNACLLLRRFERS